MKTVLVYRCIIPRPPSVPTNNGDVAFADEQGIPIPDVGHRVLALYVKQLPNAFWSVDNNVKVKMWVNSE